MKNLALVLVLLAAVAVVATVLLMDDGSAPSVVPTVEAEGTEPFEPEAELGDVELVETAPSEVPARGAEEIVREPSAASQRTALDDHLDGRTWADVLLPVSTEDGAPIEGARIIHVGRRGERRVVELDAPILEDDLHERALAAIDTDAHCFRAFLPRDIAEHSGDPINVSLHPSARVRFELRGEEPKVWPAFQAAIESDWDSWSFDAEGEGMSEFDLEDFEKFQPILAFTPNLRIILSESAEPGYRRRQVRWAARTDAVRPLLELNGEPVVFGHANVNVSPVASLPLTVDDLPDGTEVDVYQDFDEEPALVDFFGPDDTPLSWLDDVTYTTDAEQDLVVRVAFPPPGAVLGSIGPGHEGGAVAVAALDEDGEPSWFETWEAEIAEDGTFVVEGLPPGEFDLAAKWSAAGGSRFQAQRRFVLAPAQVLDLGRIDHTTGGSVTFRPVLVVDGAVDPSLLGGAFDDFEWNLSIAEEVDFDTSVFEDLEEWQLEDEAFMEGLLESQEFEEGAEHEAEDLVGFGETTFAGVEAGRYWVSTFFWEVPESVTARYRVVGFEEDRQIDVNGDVVHEIRFVLESASMVRLVAEVPAVGPGYDQWLSVVAWNDAGAVRSFDDLDDAYRSSTDEPWRFDTTVALGPGTWKLIVLVRCEIDTWLYDDDEEVPDLPPRSFVASVDVNVASVDVSETVNLELQPGASLRGTEKAFRGDDSGWGGVQLRPVGAPVELADLWFVFETDEDGALVVDGLLPLVEYALDDSERTFTAGAAGSVVDLVE